MRRFEFHDSVLNNITQNDDEIIVTFSDGTIYFGNGIDDYEFKVVLATIKNGKSDFNKLTKAATIDVFSGEVYCNEKQIEDLVLPFQFDGEVLIKLILADGQSIEISGASIKIVEK